jgi:hypothetical protein
VYTVCEEGIEEEDDQDTAKQTPKPMEKDEQDKKRGDRGS